MSFASAAFPTSDLISYYKFDETSGATGIDTFANNDLTTNATVGSSGKIETSYDYSAGNVWSLKQNFPFQSTGTASWWVKLNVLTNGKTHMLDPQNDGGIHCQVFNSKFYCAVNDGAFLISSTTPSTSTWYHVAITWDGSNERLYINGLNEANLSAGSSTSTSNLIVGAAQTLGAYLDGNLDELGIWGAAKSQAEISDLYNSGDGLSLDEAGAKITLIEPENESTISDIGSNFSVEMDAGLGFNISNVTYFVWDDSSTIFNQTTISGENQTLNNTLFIDNFVIGDYKWNAKCCWENATFSNCTFGEENLTFNVIPFSTISEDFSPSVLEGDTPNFSINISIITFERLSTISFVYNGTEFPASFVEYETNKWFLSIEKEIKEVEGIETVEFYWNVLLESGFSQNSTIHNQTISEISIDDCSVFTNQIFNFTIVDETTQDIINGATGNTSLKIDLTFSCLDNSAEIIQFSQGYSKINPARVCMNTPIGNSSLRMDAVIEYSAAEKFVEFYNIQNFVFTSINESQNIILYNLDESEGEEFKITYKGQDFIPVTDLILQLQRRYIDDGKFKTIEIPMSGTNGYTIAHLVPNNVIYNLIFIKDGIVLDTFNEVIADCQNPDIIQCEINLNALITGLDLFHIVEDGEFFSSLTFDKETREVSSTFGILSGVSDVVNLDVLLLDNFGNNTACSDSLTAAGGTLSCVVPDSFGNATIYAKVVFQEDVKNEGYISMRESPKDQYRGVLIFASTILLFLIFGIGISDNVNISAVFLIVGSLLLFGLNIFYSTSWLGAGATILWFIIAVITIIIKGGNKR